MCVFVYVYVYVSVLVCVSACVGEGAGEGRMPEERGHFQVSGCACMIVCWGGSLWWVYVCLWVYMGGGGWGGRGGGVCWSVYVLECGGGAFAFYYANLIKRSYPKLNSNLNLTVNSVSLSESTLI